LARARKSAIGSPYQNAGNQGTLGHGPSTISQVRRAIVAGGQTSPEETGPISLILAKGCPLFEV
jgi:hypothetical protein